MPLPLLLPGYLHHDVPIDFGLAMVPMLHACSGAEGVVAVGRRRRQTDEIKPFRLSLILEFFQCHDVAFASMLQSLRSSKCTIYSFQMKQFPGPERQFASLYVGIGHHNHFIVIAINLPSPL